MLVIEEPGILYKIFKITEIIWLTNTPERIHSVTLKRETDHVPLFDSSFDRDFRSLNKYALFDLPHRESDHLRRPGPRGVRNLPHPGPK